MASSLGLQDTERSQIRMQTQRSSVEHIESEVLALVSALPPPISETQNNPLKYPSLIQTITEMGLMIMAAPPTILVLWRWAGMSLLKLHFPMRPCTSRSCHSCLWQLKLISREEVHCRAWRPYTGLFQTAPRTAGSQTFSPPQMCGDSFMSLIGLPH